MLIGGREYKLNPSEKQIESAHEFIDSGADLIIGTHPHVVQSIEEYKGKMIFYSLGNFVFDQYFSENVKSELAVSVEISKNEVNFETIPLRVSDDGSLSFGEDGWKNNLLDRIANDSVVNDEIKKDIKKGKLFMEI